MIYGPCSESDLANCSFDSFPWLLRTHSDIVGSGTHVMKSSLQNNVSGKAIERHKQRSGVVGVSTLCRLPYFDIARDSLLDIMHILEGCCTHLIKLMKGGRLPKDYDKNKKRKMNSESDEEEMKELMNIRKNRERVLTQHRDIIIPEKHRKKMDELYQQIDGPPGLINVSQKPFARTGIRL